MRTGRFVEYSPDLQTRVLLTLNEHFRTSDERIMASGVVMLLAEEQTPVNLRAVDKALKYLKGKFYIEAAESRALAVHLETIMVLGMTSRGEDYAATLKSNRPTEAPAATVHTNNFHGPAVVIGAMSGGSVTQNVGTPLPELITALERLRDDLQNMDHYRVAGLERDADDAVKFARDGNIQRLGRVLNGIAQAIITTGAVPTAWAFVQIEAAKVGVVLPGPPNLPH